MRILLVLPLFIVLISEPIRPDRPSLPTVSVSAITLGQVRPAEEMSLNPDAPRALFVQRPFGAREHSVSSVLVIGKTDSELRRVQVEYGRASSSLIQVVSGLSRGDRIVVSEMQSWDSFERIRIRPD